MSGSDNLSDAIKQNNSISNMIVELFPDKPDDKRSAWIKTLEDEEIETIEDLMGLEDQLWETIKIPANVKSQINTFLQKNKQTPQANNALSDLETTIIVDYLNEGREISKILEVLKIQAGSQKEILVRSLIASVKRPPRPLPTNTKLLTVKTQGKTLPVYHYKSEQKLGKKYYTLLVIGESGSGKTTLLDAFVNRLTGMELQDQWRWKLVDEDCFSKVHTSQSQTQEINTYYVNDEKFEFNIRIIDTPGFGDTQGFGKDQKIVKQFEEYFKKIDEIDYVLVTIHSSKTRLNAGTKYIYDRVQEIFGKDAMDRFILMCTFSDDKQPSAIETLEGYLSYQRYFQFNNSALYTPIENSSVFTAQFWKMGYSSIDEFIKYIVAQNNTPLSLTMSKQVLYLRDYLQESVRTSQKQISNTILELEYSKNLINTINENKKKIDLNQSFKIKVPKEVVEKKPLDKTYQMCTNCQQTCCQICEWPKNFKESVCTYFDQKDACPKCKGCPKSYHVRAHNLIIKKIIQVDEVLQFKKEQFEEGHSQLKTSQLAINQQKTKIMKQMDELWQLIQRVKNSLNELERIALRPKIFTDEDYFLEMVQQEKDNRNHGWQERVKQLEEVLELSRKSSLIKDSKSSKDLFPSYKQLFSGCNIF